MSRTSNNETTFYFEMHPIDRIAYILEYRAIRHINITTFYPRTVFGAAKYTFFPVNTTQTTAFKIYSKLHSLKQGIKYTVHNWDCCRKNRWYMQPDKFREDWITCSIHRLDFRRDEEIYSDRALRFQNWNNQLLNVNY